MNVSVNWLAILACVGIELIVVFVWYGPLFGALWGKLVGVTEKELVANRMTAMAVMIGLSAVSFMALRHFIVFVEHFYPDYSQLNAGLLTAWWVWLGFVGANMTIAYVFAQRKWSLIAIDTGYVFVVLMLSSTVLSLWA